MGFADEVLAVSSRPGTRCSFTTIRLDASDTADLERLLADDTITSTAISKALIGRGYNIKPQTVSRHRRRACDCP